MDRDTYRVAILGCRGRGRGRYDNLYGELFDGRGFEYADR